jgi:hypothetical protein
MKGRWIIFTALIFLACGHSALARQKRIYGVESVSLGPTLETEFHLDPEALKKANFARLEELLNNARPIPTRWTEEQRLEKNLSWEPIRFLAMLKQGTYLQTIPEGKVKYVNRVYYVMVQQEDFRGKLITVFNKQGQPKYHTQINNIVALEQDLNLLSSPPRFETYPPRKESELRLVDKFIPLAHRFLWQREAFYPYYFERATQSQSVNASATRLEYNLFYMWDFPLKPGMAINKQQATWQTQRGETYSWDSTNIGPIVLYPIRNYDKYRIDATLSWQISRQSQLYSSTTSYQIDANSWQVGLQAIIPWWIGGFVIGGHYRQGRVAFQSELPPQTPAHPSEEKRPVHSLGINLGFHWDMVL